MEILEEAPRLSDGKLIPCSVSIIKLEDAEYLKIVDQDGELVFTFNIGVTS